MRSLRPIRLFAAVALGFLGAAAEHGWASAQVDEGGTPAAAQLELRIEQLEEQIRGLTGQVETQDHQIQVLTQQLEKLRSDTDLRLGDIEAKTGGGAAAASPAAGGQVPASQTAPAQVPQTAVAGAGAPTPLLSGAGTPAPGAPPRILGTIPAGAVPAAPPAAAPSSPQQQYEAALELYHQGNYPGAEKGFRAFVAQYPKDPLASNAAFWMGEGYFIRGKYQEAVGTFADALQKYPNGAKAPDTLLDLGKSLDKLGRGADACAVLGQIGAKFPSASQTIKRQAQQEKTRLRCG